MTVPHQLLRATEERLLDLIRQRMADGADTRGIDRTIWELFGERWVVMFTDLAGFSRKTKDFGITHFLQVIVRQRDLLYPIIGSHGGILVKAEADSMLLIFRTLPSALTCAVAMQRACGRANERLVDEEKVHLCLGIGVGDVLRIGDQDVWGREVNAASKLGEDTARAGEILVTEAVKLELPEDSEHELVAIDQSVAGSPRNYQLMY